MTRPVSGLGRRVPVLAGLAVLATAGALVPAGAASAGAAAVTISVYAAPAGSGSACVSWAPCGLAAAQARARRLGGQRQWADIRVVLRGGTYRLMSTMR